MAESTPAIYKQAESFAEEPILAGAMFRSADVHDLTPFSSELGVVVLLVWAFFGWVFRGFRSPQRERQFPDHDGLLFVSRTDTRLIIFAVGGFFSHQIKRSLIESELGKSTKLLRSKNPKYRVTLTLSDGSSFQLVTQDVRENVDHLIKMANTPTNAE